MPVPRTPQPRPGATPRGAESSAGRPKQKHNFSLGLENRDAGVAARSRRAVAPVIAKAAATKGSPAALAASAASTYPQRAGVGVTATTSPAMTVITTPRTPELSPAAQYMAVQYAEAAAALENSPTNWRSRLLRNETTLREMVADGIGHPPCFERLMRVLCIYDDLIEVLGSSQQPLPPLALPSTTANMTGDSRDAAPPIGVAVATAPPQFVAEMLRLCRVEFSRAIFKVQFGDEATKRSRNESPLPLPLSGTGVGPGSGAGSGSDADPNDITLPLDEDACAFFDESAQLARENLMLRDELRRCTTQEEADAMRQRIEQMEEDAAAYEAEVSRLARQCESVTMECGRTNEELKRLRAEAEERQEALQREKSALLVENKDLQLQVFQLRKQAARQAAKQLKHTYQKMKATRMGVMTTLFSEGDERVATLVMLTQLETRVNKVLDLYDSERILAPAAEHATMARKMGEEVVVLLEEMHLCEQQYRRLVPPRKRPPADVPYYQLPAEQQIETDETDAYICIIFDDKVYENFLMRDTLLRRLKKSNRAMADELGRKAREKLLARDAPDGPQNGANPLPESGSPIGSVSRASTARSGPRSASALPESMTTVAAAAASGANTGPAPLAQLVLCTKEEWIDNIFHPREGAPERLTNGGVAVSHHRSHHSRPALERMRQFAHQPLADVSSNKFQTGVDLFAGPDPAQQHYVCSVPHIDPTSAVALPEQTRFVKVKHGNSLRFPTDPSAAAPGGTWAEEDDEGAPGSAKPWRPSMRLRRRIASGRVPSPAGPARAERMMSLAAAPLAQPLPPPLNAEESLRAWGGSSVFQPEVDQPDEPGVVGGPLPRRPGIMGRGDNFLIFDELSRPNTLIDSLGVRPNGGATGTTTAASTVAFQRLDPLSQRRDPEWLLYRTLFGGYRTLTPRMLEITTMDHILLCACETHFVRMEYRYAGCLVEASQHATSSEMEKVYAERIFREEVTRTDFQEAVVDELEARYGFPELVAKTLYEMLCYMDAMSERSPLIQVYLNVIRGFRPATDIHHICWMLHQLHYSWPTSSMTEAISREDALTVLRYLYTRIGTVVHVDPQEVLRDYEMSTRSDKITLVQMREFMATSMLHNEEPIVLYFSGLFRGKTTDFSRAGVQGLTARTAVSECTFGLLESVLGLSWTDRATRRYLVRYLSAAVTVDHGIGGMMTTRDLVGVSLSGWCSNI